MSWNHRVVRKVYPNGETQFGIHEVYYGDRGMVEAVTEEPVKMSSDDAEDLRLTLDRMILAFGNSVLDYDKIPEPERGL